MGTSPPVATPFRSRYLRASALDLESQLKECTEYLENPEVLVMEFLESYYLVERESHPEESQRVEEVEEMVLEPFFDSLQLYIEDEGGKVERLICAGGAFDPIPGKDHPAHARQGLDYIGMRGGSAHIILGVTTNPSEQTPFQMLLRVLNCFAEVAPPFQLARLRSQVIRDRIDPDAVFDLQMASSLGRPQSMDASALAELTRDLAEVFHRRIEENDQFQGTLGRIEYLEITRDLGESGRDGEPPETMRVRWRV